MGKLVGKLGKQDVSVIVDANSLAAVQAAVSAYVDSVVPANARIVAGLAAAGTPKWHIIPSGADWHITPGGG